MKLSLKITKRKECTVLTWPARLIIFAVFFLISAILFFRTPIFLSKNKPVNGDYLILDGQMPDYAVKNAIDLFNNSKYKIIISTGGKLASGYYISGEKTMAELTRSVFIALNFDSTKIVAIPGGDIMKNRTYSSGLSLRTWFAEQNITLAKVDILAIGCHARRSNLLFQKALGENFQVGVINIEDKTYDIKKWWKTSKGTRTIISETIAFIYVKLLFSP